MYRLSLMWRGRRAVHRVSAVLLRKLGAENEARRDGGGLGEGTAPKAIVLNADSHPAGCWRSPAECWHTPLAIADQVWRLTLGHRGRLTRVGMSAEADSGEKELMTPVRTW